MHKTDAVDLLDELADRRMDQLDEPSASSM